MAHTIDCCPRCGKDFMYHASDQHRLSRAVAWDADTKEPCSFVVICQNCDDKEREDNGTKVCVSWCCTNTAQVSSQYCPPCLDEKLQIN